MTGSEQILNAARELFIKLGRKPSQREIAAHIHVSQRTVSVRIARLRGLGNQEVITLTKASGGAKDSGFYVQRFRPGTRPKVSRRVISGVRAMLQRQPPTDQTLEAWHYLDELATWHEQRSRRRAARGDAR
jgi:hypothetical protein